MAVPRGIKAILKRTAPCKLTGHGKWRGFQLVDRERKPVGNRFKGLTKVLERHVFSDGQLPSSAVYGDVHRGGWKGKGGGRRRGKAVDAQLSRAISKGKILPQKGQYKLTQLVLASLKAYFLTPIASQRAVCNKDAFVGTAIDILCYRDDIESLVVVELKCGCSGNRKDAANLRDGTKCHLKGTFHRAKDCVLNRHLAQLALTREMFASEQKTLSDLGALGVQNDVDAALLYVDDAKVSMYPLSAWWRQRAPRALKALSECR